MKTERKWEIMHDYRRAVRRGLAEPYLCYTDHSELVPVVDIDDNPALKCLVCRSVSHIGLEQLEAMEAKL